MAVQSSWDNLAAVCSNIIADGASLCGISHGAMTFILFGLLLPLAVIFMMVSSGLALAGGKLQRRFAIGVYVLGIIAVAAFLALVAYSLICGSTWASAPY